ncbi:hypothetical protein, partial [Nonomuraea diastatica]|uniref:hypothetical protein n=1 Tax=Nonomuraea diastatica TaxID=1848329 RepID=UPI001C70218D
EPVAGHAPALGRPRPRGGGRGLLRLGRSYSSRPDGAMRVVYSSIPVGGQQHGQRLISAFRSAGVGSRDSSPSVTIRSNSS